MELLGRASGTTLSSDDAENIDYVDYVNNLREAVLETYISIMHGILYDIMEILYVRSRFIRL